MAAEALSNPSRFLVIIAIISQLATIARSYFRHPDSACAATAACSFNFKKSIAYPSIRADIDLDA